VQQGGRLFIEVHPDPIEAYQTPLPHSLEELKDSSQQINVVVRAKEGP
jgi:hypothetical protein